MAIYHKGIKISNLYHSGKKIKSLYYHGIKIYLDNLPIGYSLYDGIPSKGIILYDADAHSYSSTNPLGIHGDSINLKAPLSSCPNGIKIHFSNTSYNGNGSEDGTPNIPDISIPKGSSSGSSTINSYYSGSIKASINGTTLSFSVHNTTGEDYFTGTVGDTVNDENTGDLLAILSITAY